MSLDIISKHVITVGSGEGFNRVFVDTRPINLFYNSVTGCYRDSSGTDIVGIKGKKLQDALRYLGFIS